MWLNPQKNDDSKDLNDDDIDLNGLINHNAPQLTTIHHNSPQLTTQRSKHEDYIGPEMIHWGLNQLNSLNHQKWPIFWEFDGRKLWLSPATIMGFKWFHHQDCGLGWGWEDFLNVIRIHPAKWGCKKIKQRESSNEGGYLSIGLFDHLYVYHHKP